MALHEVHDPGQLAALHGVVCATDVVLLVDAAWATPVADLAQLPCPVFALAVPEPDSVENVPANLPALGADAWVALTEAHRQYLVWR